MNQNYFYVILLSITISAYSQDIVVNDNYVVPIRSVIGDLNNDGLEDRVTVMMDTIGKTRPLRLQIFFTQNNGKSKLIVSSTKIIEAQYPIALKGKHNGNTIPNFYIEKGNLIMECYVNDTTRHTFRFKNGYFRLIHFLKMDWDGKETTIQTKYDLLTGNYVEEFQLLGSDEVFEKNKKKFKVKPLPKIQNFVPFETELY